MVRGFCFLGSSSTYISTSESNAYDDRRKWSILILNYFGKPDHSPNK